MDLIPKLKIKTTCKLVAVDMVPNTKKRRNLVVVDTIPSMKKKRMVVVDTIPITRSTKTICSCLLVQY